MEVDNITVLIISGGNPTCACPDLFGRIIEASRNNFAIALVLFGIFSNLLTIVTLQRVRKKTSTEKLMLAITIAGFALPVLHRTRDIYVETQQASADMSFFRILLFYLWHVFSAVSTLLTVVLAADRVIAVEYAKKFRQHINYFLAAVCICCAIVSLPMLIYEKFAGNCVPEARSEVLYFSLLLNSLGASKTSYMLKFFHWLYALVFDLLCPCILARLCIRFRTALRRTVVSLSNSSNHPELMETNATTRLVLIVSLLTVTRDLPVGLISASFLLFSPDQHCLITFRVLAKELSIAMSAFYYFALYFTNRRFREAVPWCGSTSEKNNGRQEIGELNEINSTCNLVEESTKTIN